MVTVIVSLLIMAIAIYFLAIITDEFFIVSLDQISTRLKLPNNVAGASLMAMGSSAPELAIALLALFRGGEGGHGDLGIGTIVGSAVFNILIITGVSAIARPAHVTWRVVVRDVVMYLASIALLIVTFFDSNITLLEAIYFVGLYAVYIIILFNWEAFAGEEDETNVVEDVSTEIEASHESGGVFSQITAVIAKAIGFTMGNAKVSYIRAFIVSILYIAILSFVLVEAAIAFAEALHIPSVIVGLTLLAAGTSVPDLIASIVVARQGRGDMAISNAVGSNIFDILIGLGVPWIVAMVILGDTIHVGTDGLWNSTIILLATVVLLFVFLSTGKNLSRREGWVLVLAYVGYVVWIWMGAA